MTDKKIAVVILNWNGVEMMRRFIPSVVSYSQEADVIVADNGSTDDSLQMLRAEFPAVRIIQLDRNYGFAEGYNKALSQIGHPYSILLNSDVEVSPGWLRPMLDYMESHPDIAACQPKIIKESERASFEYAGASGGYIDWLGYPFCRGRLMSTVEEDHGQYNQPVSIFFFSFAALMVRTELYKELGGLDARFFAHQEEIDFCWRLHNRGYQLMCIPQSVVYHVGGGTLNQGDPRKTFLNFRNNLLLLYKNLPLTRRWRVMPLRCVLDYVAALQMCLTGHRKDALAVLHARQEFSHIRHEFDDKRDAELQAQRKQEAVSGHKFDIPEIMPSSLLWQYYVKGRTHFSQLKWK